MKIRAGRPEDHRELLSIDDDATLHYGAAGVVIELPPQHPFVRAEQARWAAALGRGDVLLAEVEGEAVGFAAMDEVDGALYLDQLSVRRRAMGRGVGSALLERVIDRAGGPVLLTTYGHLPFNQPFYARRGFERVPEAAWGEETRAIVAEQRAALPDPGERVVMRHPGRR